MNPLYHELWHAFDDRGRDPGMREWLETLGIDHARQVLTNPGPIGTSHVVTYRTGVYEPTTDPQGPKFVIVPVYDEFDNLCDLLAFHPNRPRTWFTRRGDSQFLGFACLIRSGADNRPLNMVETPLEYLQAEPNSVVFPITFEGIASHLHDWPGPLVCSSIGLATRLELELNPTPPKPTVRITVRENPSAAQKP